MRKKPLNPNCMAVIMENFRRYQTVLESEYGETDNLVYLFEDNQKIPTTSTFDKIFEQNNNGDISDQELLNIWESSFEYESQEILHMQEQHFLQEQEENKESEPEKTVEAPGWLRKLGQLFNKALKFLKGLVKKSIDIVISGAERVYKFAMKFKEKQPILFKLIFYGIIALLSLAVIYAVVVFLQAVMEDPNYQEGAALAPLCAQAVAATALQEEVGKCLMAGQVLTEENYLRAQGFLKLVGSDKEGDEAAVIKAAQSALTKCYESAKTGSTIKMKWLLDGSSQELGVLKNTSAALEKLEQAASPEGGGYDWKLVEMAKKDLAEYGKIGDEYVKRIDSIGSRIGKSISSSVERTIHVPDIAKLDDEEALNVLRQLVNSEESKRTMATAARVMMKAKPHLKDQIEDIFGGGAQPSWTFK